MYRNVEKLPKKCTAKSNQFPGEFVTRLSFDVPTFPIDPFSRANRCAILQVEVPGHLQFRVTLQGALPHSVSVVPPSVFGNRVLVTGVAGLGKFIALLF